jgi:LysM repeat protein
VGPEAEAEPAEVEAGEEPVDEEPADAEAVMDEAPLPDLGLIRDPAPTRVVRDRARAPRLVAPAAVRRLFAAWLVAVLLLAGLAGSGLAQQRYVVKDGDTLESIAAEFGVDPEAILRASWMASPPNPRPGEVLVIPDPGQSPDEAAEVAAAREGTSPWVSGAYVVQPGDSIEYIAGIYGVDPNALADL